MSLLQEITKQILSAQLAVADINFYLDQFCNSQKICFPKNIEIKISEIQKCVDELKLADETFEDEDSSGCDKENDTSEEYFSPNIQIRKSTAENIDLYTPALKTNKKSRHH